MTREEAIKEATEAAKRDQIEMVVAFNPFDDEAETDEEKYGFYPATAVKIFRFEKVVETIKP